MNCKNLLLEDIDDEELLCYSRLHVATDRPLLSTSLCQRARRTANADRQARSG